MQAHLRTATAGADVIARAGWHALQPNPPNSIGSACAWRQLLHSAAGGGLGGERELLHRAPPLALVDAARLHMTVYWVSDEQQTACHAVEKHRESDSLWLI